MMSAIKKVFSKETHDQKLERYMGLHFEWLSKGTGATMNTDILTHALGALGNGYTPEETVMRSILFDIALQAEANEDSVLKMMALLKSSTATLKSLAMWCDGGKISRQVWNEDAPNFYSICSLQHGQKETLAAVLHDLRNPIIV